MSTQNPIVNNAIRASMKAMRAIPLTPNHTKPFDCRIFLKIALHLAITQIFDKLQHQGAQTKLSTPFSLPPLTE